MEQQLLTRRAFVQKAVWLYESDVLFFPRQHPENEIRVKVTRLKETNTLATAQVSKQEQLHAILLQNGFVFVAPTFQVGDELVFAFVERHRQDGYLPAAPDMEQRLEQMFAEIACIQLAHL